MTDKAQTIKEVERARDYMLQSKSVPEPAKDSLNILLDRAKACANGHPDKVEAMSQALSALICYIVKGDVRLPDKVGKIVEKHVKDCPINKGPQGWLGVLYLFRWPLVILGIFSPHFPRILDLAVRLIGAG